MESAEMARDIANRVQRPPICRKLSTAAQCLRRPTTAAGFHICRTGKASDQTRIKWAAKGGHFYCGRYDEVRRYALQLARGQAVPEDELGQMECNFARLVEMFGLAIALQIRSRDGEAIYSREAGARPRSGRRTLDTPRGVGRNHRQYSRILRLRDV